MSAPDISAIEERLAQLRNERQRVAQQLHAAEAQREDLDFELGRLDASIQVLEDMLKEQE
ncbi:MAG: hypothetical protein LBI66_09365 [Burkholderiaceae bacterium]|jgi:ribosomal 50S subunit-associated protein YjgA (DUF615 family)|nr:hypothetical protein [Burkholderiaceae bacterium]